MMYLSSLAFSNFSIVLRRNEIRRRPDVSPSPFNIRSQKSLEMNSASADHNLRRLRSRKAASKKRTRHSQRPSECLIGREEHERAPCLERSLAFRRGLSAANNHFSFRVIQGLMSLVSIRPKPTAFTVTLYLPHSLARVLVSPITPAFPEEYPACPGLPSVPEMEVMFTTFRTTTLPSSFRVSPWNECILMPHAATGRAPPGGCPALPEIVCPLSSV